MSIFQPCELGVLRVPSSCATTNASTAVISIDNQSIQLPITGFTLDLGTNHQFLHALDEFIYLYAFGDRIGELTVTGIAFTTEVGEDGACDSLTAQLGPSALLKYYLDNRIARKAAPQKTLIQIDPKTGSYSDAGVLVGFLTGMRFDMPNPALPIVQWVLRYHIIVDASKVTGATP